MQHLWQLQEAKNRFSQVVDEALKDGPQTITRRGKETVVVISIEYYQALKGHEGGLGDFLKSSPLAGSGLDITRSKERPRKVDL